MELAPDWVLALVGAGGFGRQMKPYAVAQTRRMFGSAEGRVCFVDDEPPSSSVNGIPCLTQEEFLALDCESKVFSVMVHRGELRQKVAERWLGFNLPPFTISTETTEFNDPEHVGRGGVFGAYTVIGANAHVGEFLQMNRYSYITHDCRVGDYVTIAANVACNGNVHIGDRAYIGSGAQIRNGTPEEPLIIGEGAVVGMGSVVTRDVEPYTVVAGNPARVRPPARRLP